LFGVFYRLRDCSSSMDVSRPWTRSPEHDLASSFAKLRYAGKPISRMRKHTRKMALAVSRHARNAMFVRVASLAEEVQNPLSATC
jgi:hypothetical protein